jgi:hypothetical protein
MEEPAEDEQRVAFSLAGKALEGGDLGVKQLWKRYSNALGSDTWRPV